MHPVNKKFCVLCCLFMPFNEQYVFSGERHTQLEVVCEGGNEQTNKQGLPGKADTSV
jgi:hypothetical protein